MCKHDGQVDTLSFILLRRQNSYLSCPLLSQNWNFPDFWATLLRWLSRAKKQNKKKKSYEGPEKSWASMCTGKFQVNILLSLVLKFGNVCSAGPGSSVDW